MKLQCLQYIMRILIIDINNHFTSLSIYYHRELLIKVKDRFSKN